MRSASLIIISYIIVTLYICVNSILIANESDLICRATLGQVVIMLPDPLSCMYLWLGHESIQDLVCPFLKFSTAGICYLGRLSKVAGGLLKFFIYMYVL